MNDKVRLFSFFLYFLHICYLSDCEDVDRFICKTADDVNNLIVERVFSIDYKVFIILKDKFIFFPMPICYQKANYASNGITCAIGHSLVTNQVSENLNDDKNRLKGYFFIDVQSLTYAIYENTDTNELTVRYIHVSDTIKQIDEDTKKDKYKEEIDRFRNAKYTLYHRFNSKEPFALISFNETDKLNVEFNEENRSYKKTIEINDYKLSELMTYYQYSHHSNVKDKKSLILIDNNSQKIHISFFEIKNGIQMSSRSIEFKEFFNCHKQLEDPSELKGIYFNDGIFFIFIKRFYLQINEDLFKTSFELTDQHYNDIKELSSSNFLKFFFDIEMPKYVKTIQSKAYFVCFNEVYKLTYEDQKLNLKSENGFDLIRECPFSTIELNKFIFCFTPDHYYAIFKGKTPITKQKFNKYKDIFNDTGIEFNEDEKVQIVFSISEQKFVLMTLKSFYSVNYDVADVIEKENNRISLNGQAPGLPIVKGELFLFSGNTKKPEIDHPSKIKRDSDSPVLLIILICFVIGTILLVFYLKKNEILSLLQPEQFRTSPSDISVDKKCPQKFEERKNLSGKDIQRKKNYRKLFKSFFSSLSKSLSIFHINPEQTVKSKTESIKSKTESINPKPDLIKAKPESIKSKPESIRYKPEPIKSKPESIKSKTDSIKSKTDSIKSKSLNDKAKKWTKDVNLSDTGSLNTFDSSKLHGGTKSFGHSKSKFDNKLGQPDSNQSETDSLVETQNMSELDKKAIVKKINNPSINSYLFKR